MSISVTKHFNETKYSYPSPLLLFLDYGIRAPFTVPEYSIQNRNHEIHQKTETMLFILIQSYFDFIHGCEADAERSTI